MTEQQKIFRILNLIKLLVTKPRKIVPELAQLIDTSKDTIYRYINLLGDIGYDIDKDHHNAYYIFEPSNTSSITFELEETELLNQLISTIHQDHPLRTSLQNKIFLISPLLPLAEDLANKHLALIISRLNTAIKDRKRVELIKYHSQSSGTI